MWKYCGYEIIEADLDGYKAFVYRITNNKNGKQYLGKKRLTTYRRKIIKGRKNRKKIVSSQKMLFISLGSITIKVSSAVFTVHT